MIPYILMVSALVAGAALAGPKPPQCAVSENPQSAARFDVNGGVLSLAWSPDSHMVAFSRVAGRVRTVAIGGDSFAAGAFACPWDAQIIAQSRDGRLLAGQTASHFVSVRDASTGTVVAETSIEDSEAGCCDSGRRRPRLPARAEFSA